MLESTPIAGLQCRERGALSGITGMGEHPDIAAVLQCRERGALSGIRQGAFPALAILGFNVGRGGPSPVCNRCWATWGRWPRFNVGRGGPSPVYGVY